MTAPVQIYTTDHCGYCVRAKMLLTKRNIAFDEIDVSTDDEKRAWLVKATGQRTVPQIFIHGTPIGGASELHELDRSGELARRLAVPQSA
ncbi:glutaredoxin 3 [Pendulispora albinea]|uniref:Glutaredoxin n=1 Tax=Pendulispora albinea TaxID=2741071 RepID=A0ABZ2LXT0_9BACT